MHILVCDDDAVFAAQMDEYISEWFRAREIQVQSTVCTSGEQLLATPELERYQLAFLDVDLKTTDGIALGRRLRQVAPDIVLVYISAYLEFAPQGYTVNAYRYLLKRDIAAQLPSCLEDIFAGMTDPKRRWRCVTTVPPARYLSTRSIIWKVICGRSTSTAISRTSPSAPFTAKSPICPPCCTKTVFAGRAQRCGQSAICAFHPQL